jgi:hypothetical protein
MWDQILGALGQLQTINSDTTKTFRIRSVSAHPDKCSFTLTGEEHRDQSLFTSIFELLGLIGKPVVAESKLDDTGLRLTFVTETGPSSTELESEIFVARKALNTCLVSITRPTAGIFIVLGLLTVFTIIGPLIAYILYKRQKHKVSFGFDSSSDVGLVLSFIGDESLQGKLLPLLAIGRNYLSLSSGADAPTPTSEPPAPPPAADAGVRDIECRINGQEVFLVTKAELIQMARGGSLKRSDEVRRVGQTWVAADRIAGLFR